MQRETLKGEAEPRTQRGRILIADDQPDVLDALRLLLKGHDYSIETVSSPALLLEALRRAEFDLVLMDLNYARDTTSGREGIDVLGHLKEIASVPPIVVMTGWATVGLAVEVMQQGVCDFVEKPWSNARLLEIVEKQIAEGRVQSAARQLSSEEARTNQHMALELSQQKHELAEALAIQRRLLPTSIPQIHGMEIAADWQPARTVGGDYFDVIALDEKTLGICIADVAGKGLPAALLMSNLQAAVRGIATPSLTPERFCAKLNALLGRNISDDRFVTLFYAILNVNTRQLHYANAGHNPPFLLRANGKLQRLTEGGPVLGVFPDARFRSRTIELAPGDRVVLFTDGITEARNCNDEEFGDARLLDCLEHNRCESARVLHGHIFEAAAEFCNNVWQDDATLLVLASY